MSGFFKPLRRKIGLVTLMLACVFMVGWLRSLMMQDAFLLSISDCSKLRLASFRSHLICERVESPFRILVTAEEYNRVRVVVPDQDRAFGFGPESYHWSLQAAGFSIGEVRHKSLGWPRCTMWMIPYWSILIPLILLSAWLLLSKPRTKPEWMIEPSAENT